MKRLNVFFAALLCVLMASPAYALNLSQGKSQGLVGERLDGYIGAVSSASPEVQQLVSEVNRARKAEYLKIASQNGQPISVVEKLAAKKLIERADPGTYYMNAGGTWEKK